jgi:dihydropteroate synthase
MGDKSTAFNKIRSIKIDINRHINFDEPKIMGILNLTPDSFYDGGVYSDVDSILGKVDRMLSEGADIIDMGACSTRPGARSISEDEELSRIIEPVRLISARFPEAVISVDTYRSKVAKETIATGAHIINDISGGTMDDEMFTTIAQMKVPYILMHIHGTPQTMQESPISSNITNSVYNFFSSRIDKLNSLGVDDIILDPGFGFGKTLECNYKLLKNINDIRINSLPVLAGISRKSMINKVLKTNPDTALNGTTSLNTISLLSGANILRVHDVSEAKQVVQLIDFMRNCDDC